MQEPTPNTVPNVRDLASPEGLRDPHAVYARFRAAEAAGGDIGRVVVRYEQVASLLADRRLSSARVGGIASALGVWMLSTRFFRKLRLRKLLAVTCVLTALGHLLLALNDTVWLYVLAFTLAAFLNASMMPATNTMIALNVSRERRGTAFGIGSAAQAVAFMVGPMAAAMFATVSLKAGFVAVSVVLVGLAVLVAVAVREPAGEK